MKKISLLVITVVCISCMLAAAGCITTQQRVEYRQLSGKQKAQAEDWLNSANLLYNVKDYNSALEYYEKVVHFYPGTLYASRAQSRIDEIKGMQ